MTTTSDITTTMRAADGRGRAAVHCSRLTVILGGLIALGAAAASAVGLWSSGGPGATTVSSVRGELVTLYGEGLYRYDSELIAMGARGSDAVTLFLLVPALVWALLRHVRRSLTATVVLSGLLGWTLYYYASLALGSAFNRLLPLYVLLFAMSLWALLLVLRSVDPTELAERWPHRPSRRLLTGYLLAVAAALVLAWAPPLAAAAWTGAVPAELDAYTTSVTSVLDLAVVAPGAVVIAVLLRRGTATGMLLTSWMLALNVALGLALLGQGAAQLLADVQMTTADIVLKMGFFAVLTVVASTLLLRLLRGLHEPPRAIGRGGPGRGHGRDRQQPRPGRVRRR